MSFALYNFCFFKATLEIRPAVDGTVMSRVHDLFTVKSNIVFMTTKSVTKERQQH